MTKYGMMLFNIRNKYNIHIIAITHNPFVMIQNIVVYDFESKELVLASEYIEKIGKVKIEFITPEEK